MIERRITILSSLLIIGLALALIAVVYAQSTKVDPVSKPYLEVEGTQGAGSSLMADSGAKRWAEGDGGLTGRLVAEASTQDRGWAEGAAGPSGRTQLEGVGLQEWLDTTAGGDLSVLYVFSGATDDGEQGSANRKKATSIHCTNLGLENTQVEVQLYQWNGTDVYTGTVNMPPNRSITFSTQNTTIYFDDVILGGSPGTTAIFQGSGRVLSSQPRVICTAQVLDPLNYPPTFLSAVELFRE